MTSGGRKVKIRPCYRYSLANLSADCDKRQITFVEDDNSPQNAPAWSPDGDAIAYAGSEKEDLGVPTINIYTIKPDGSDLTRLTFRVDKLTSDIPAWSPNGDFIYFGSVKSGLMETWVMREDGTDQQALFPDTVYPSRLPITSTTFENITSEIMNSDTVSDAISCVSSDNFSSDTAFVVWNDNGDSSCGCDGCF